MKEFTKKERINIQRETLAYLERNKRLCVASFNSFNYSENRSNQATTNIKVVAMDTLECVVSDPKKSCFLIFANATSAGGGYQRGSPAQEENVCRRTDLATYFSSMKYPLNEFGGIYISNLTIFRDTEANNYKWLEKPIKANAILAAAYRNPDDSPKITEKIYKKICSVLQIAFEKGEKRLILGAWGCGAYSNDNILVSKLFKKALREYYFEEVIFAILPLSFSDNLKIFTEILG